MAFSPTFSAGDPTFLSSLLTHESRQIDAELTPEQKESVETFAKRLCDWLIPKCWNEIDIRAGRVKELPIQDSDFPHFKITPAFIVAACAKLDADPYMAGPAKPYMGGPYAPQMPGPRFRYFERTVRWEAAEESPAGAMDIRGVRVEW